MKPFELSNKTKLELSAPIDPSLLKTREMGKESLTYVSQNTVVDLLNQAFNYMWSFVIDEQWLEQGVPVVKKENPKWPFTEKNTDMSQVQIDAEGKRYIVLEQGPVAWTRGRIRVPFKDESTGETIWIEKSACGAQAIIGNQAVQSTNAFKGSMSDCLKKCASLFGIALELYRDEDEEAHFQTLRDNYHPDVWTAEVIAENQKDYDKLMGILESYEWSLDDISYYVSVATDNAYSSFMKMPVEYMEALIVAIQEDGE
jgi:hypothetical protein